MLPEEMKTAEGNADAGSDVLDLDSPQTTLDQVDAELDKFEQELANPDKTVNETEDKPKEAEPIQPDGTKPPPEPDKTEGIVKVNEEYIASQPEELRNYLEGIKGEQLSPKALKNYINSQDYIAKQKQARETQSQQQLPPDVQTQIAETTKQITRNNLKAKFPDMPIEAVQSEDGFKEWLRDLNIDDPMQMYDVREEYRKIHDETQRVAGELHYISSNWETHANEAMVKEIEKFKADLAKKGIKPEDLGIDLTYDPQKKNDYITESVLKRNGQLDNGVVFLEYSKYPRVIENGVYRKLIELNYDKIADMIEIKGRQAGYEAKKQNQPPPSMSAAGIAAKRDTTLPKTVNDLTVEEIDKELRKIDVEIASNVRL